MSHTSQPRSFVHGSAFLDDLSGQRLLNLLTNFFDLDFNLTECARLLGNRLVDQYLILSEEALDAFFLLINTFFFALVWILGHR